MRFLADLHVQGVTLVICTPYMDEAERCSRVGLMYQGKLLVCETPEQIKRLPEGDLLAVWPSDVRQARRALAGLEGVLEMQTYGDQLRAFVTDAEAAMPRIADALAQDGITLRDMHPTRVRMEEAFITLVRRQRAQEESAPEPSGGQPCP